MTIRSLFDPSKDIYRTIEKVITYGASQEGRLKAEISEYVVTESIEEQFRKLNVNEQLQALTLMDDLRAISTHLAGAAKYGAASALDATVQMVTLQRQFENATQALQAYKRLDQGAVELGRAVARAVNPPRLVPVWLVRLRKCAIRGEAAEHLRPAEILAGIRDAESLERHTRTLW